MFLNRRIQIEDIPSSAVGDAVWDPNLFASKGEVAVAHLARNRGRGCDDVAHPHS